MYTAYKICAKVLRKKLEEEVERMEFPARKLRSFRTWTWNTEKYFCIKSRTMKKEERRRQI